MLAFQDASKAIDFYKSAFDAVEKKEKKPWTNWTMTLMTLIPDFTN